MPPRLNPSPETLITRAWADYALLDSGDGRKLERYGPYTVVRPEPQCFWAPRDAEAFDAADAVFDPTDEDE
ncbi:MAG TPA: class I SAM-dependent rRNA methyltransferase, partial [Brevundimonas sp.]|nr:class I SAM-dependent rRNA methyltransferase [Brevundimonas sp.]